MGSGTQLIALVPRNAVVSVQYSGRRYGNPCHRLYKFIGTSIVTMTPEELELLDEDF